MSKPKKKKRKTAVHKSLLKLKYSKMKMSEIIWEFASDYILLGEKLEHKQNLLNSAVTAWNVGNLPLEKQKEALDQYMESFKNMNPNINIIEDLREDMEKLIQEKITKFNNIKKQIVNAEIYQENDKFRITVASADTSNEYT